MSDWTVETLRALMDQRFRAQEEAIAKAERASELREIKNNEFRGQLADQASKFPTRVEMDSRFAALEDKVASKNLQIMLSLGVGFVGVLIAVFNLASSHG